MNKAELSVREIEKSDIQLIADYWTKSDPAYLESLGVDLEKMPSADQFNSMLLRQLASPYRQKENFALIWYLKDEPIGHCNINQIEFGKRANMHLHIWNAVHRGKGFGTALIPLSLPHFFKKFELEELYCEPYSINNAPNEVLKKYGFTFIITHTAVPGSINFEQEVNKWLITRAEVLK